jgi:hypothetical protein
VCVVSGGPVEGGVPYEKADYHLAQVCRNHPSVEEHGLRPGSDTRLEGALPSGEAVWGLNGERDALVENYVPWARFAPYPNVYRITYTGNAFYAIRLKDNALPASGQAESPSLQR